jgi:molecular chaperone DnaJ
MPDSNFLLWQAGVCCWQYLLMLLQVERESIRCCMQVPYVDAILGTTVNVTTVDGMVDLKIPEGTQPGTTLLLAKRGAPSPMKRTNERGDHLIKVKVCST